MSLSFEVAVFLTNLPNHDTFSDDILCAKADLLQVLTVNMEEKKLFNLTFLPSFFL